MIIDDIKNAGKYIKAFPYLVDAFEFILKIQRSSLFEGKVDINNNMYATIEKATPKPPSKQKLETHARFVDLHYIIEGSDCIGWKSAFECKDINIDYNKEKDIAFFNETPDFKASINAGKFALIFPEDAHAPLSGKENVIKCIIKIKTEIQK